MVEVGGGGWFVPRGDVALSRRRLLKAGVVGGALLAMEACTAPPAPPAPSVPAPSEGRYGPLLAADANGIGLPAGFRARRIAVSGDIVANSTYSWHPAPDGGRTFPVAGGGWVYVSNSEVAPGGGVGMIRFDAAGSIVGAQRLLDQTNMNCSGGDTPWGTWLSCEEVAGGLVYEVDPLGLHVPRKRAAMGRFRHEGAAVDALHQTVYLTEDEPDGLLYRYRYAQPADLTAGVLEAAQVVGAQVQWLAIPDPTGKTRPTRTQVPAATRFGGGEGVWFADGIVNFTTKYDDKVWAYDIVTQRLSVVYDWTTNPNPIVRGVDNVAVRNRALFICQDPGTPGQDPSLFLIEPGGRTSIFLRVYGQRSSELTGVAFAPRGDRLYVSSQRGVDGRGITYEVVGPFA